jgi:hypothetical protein
LRISDNGFSTARPTTFRHVLRTHREATAPSIFSRESESHYVIRSSYSCRVNFDRFGILCLVVSSLAACGIKSSAGSLGSTRASSGSAGTNGGTAQAGFGGSHGTEPQIDVDAGLGDSDGGVCGTACSPDLRSITNCKGEIIKSCPENTACAGTECIAPCKAAERLGSTLGCDFYSVAPSGLPVASSGCFAAMLANTWTSPLKIEVEYGGATLDVAQFARIPQGSGDKLAYQPLPAEGLPPGKLAILFLAHSKELGGIECPAGIKPASTDRPELVGTGFGKTFHIKTNLPVSAYDIFPYGGAQSFITSATLLIPSSAWGTNYVSADGYAHLSQGFEKFSPFTQIVAAEDDTSVIINPKKAILPGNGVPGGPANTPQTYKLSKGQLLQFAQDAKLAGSAISADKPIGVWGGSGCMNVPVLECCCDSAHQQFLPVKALGFEHVAARYRNRMAGLDEQIPWTVTGTVDNTQLKYTPEAPLGAPLVINSGQVVTFDADTPFTITSSDAEHPFHLMSHMTAGAVVCPERQNIPTALQNRCGDPDFVNNVPPQQWLASYVFLTDPTYLNTHLVFVRKKASDGTFKDVTLDCLGPVSDFKPVAPGGPYEVARVDLVVEGKERGACGNGVHNAHSSEPFSLTVWGWDAWASYAYPAGMSVRPLNTVIVRPDPK